MSTTTPAPSTTTADLERRLRIALKLMRDVRYWANLDAVEDDWIATAIRHVAAVAKELRGDDDREQVA